MHARRRTALLLLTLACAVAWLHRPMFSGAVIAGRDAFRFFFPAYAFIAQSLGQAELPLWNPYLRLGQPFAAALITQGFYPPAWVAALALGPVRGYLAMQLVHVCVAAIGTFLLARRLRRTVPASLVAAAAFACSPLFVDLSGHRNVVDAAAWTGFILWATLRLVASPSWARAGRVAAFATLAFLAGSPETLVWQALLALAVALAHGWRRPRAVIASVTAAVWTPLMAAAALLPAVELARDSGRGGPFHTPLDWSASPVQLLALVWPRADLPRGEYWGPDQWWMITLFAGSAAGLLAIAGVTRRRQTLPFLVGGALLALLSLGQHFAPSAFVLSHGPLSAFRFPAKYLVGAAFCLAMLAATGVDRLALLARRLRRPAVAALLAFVLAVVAILAVPPLLRALEVRRGVTDGLLWVTAAALLLTVIAVRLARTPSRARWGLAAVVATELLAYHALNAPFGWERPDRLERSSALAAAIPPGFPGRVSVPLSDTWVSSPGLVDRSRDALIPNRSVEERLRALEGYGAPEPWVLDHFQHAGHRAVFDLTGVAYFARLGPPPFPDLVEVASSGDARLYRSATALPRAFVVHRAVSLPRADFFARLRELPTQTLREQVFLEETSEALPGADCTSTAALREDGLQRVRVDVDACAAGYLVLSDSHAPGWTAAIDGQPAPLLRADGVLRAVAVPAGRHSVTFEYRPRAFVLGAALTLAALLAWLFAELQNARAARRLGRTARGTARAA